MVLSSPTGGVLRTRTGQLVAEVKRLSLSLKGVQDMVLEGVLRSPLAGLAVGLETVGVGLVLSVEGPEQRMRITAEKARGTWSTHLRAEECPVSPVET